MMHYLHSRMALLTAICMLGIACTEGPTETALEGLEPSLDHKGRPHGGGGGKTEGTPLQITFRTDASTDKIVSDGAGTYVHDVCGVRADFPPSGSGDVTFDADGGRPPKGQDRKTCAFPRFITLRFDDPIEGVDPGPTLSGGFFLAVNDVESVTVAGVTELRDGQFNTSHCRLEFSPLEVPGSNLLQVTKNANGSWTIETRPAPNDVASCADGVRAYHMPFRITVGRK